MPKRSHSAVTSAFPRDKRPPASSTSALCIHCLFGRTEPYKDTYSNNNIFLKKGYVLKGQSFNNVRSFFCPIRALLQ